MAARQVTTLAPRPFGMRRHQDVDLLWLLASLLVWLVWCVVAVWQAITGTGDD